MSSPATSTYKSLLHEMTQTTPTCLWNDSASISELQYSLENGAVGATCNPVIVISVLKKEFDVWKGRIQALANEFPIASEDEIAWHVVREMSAKVVARRRLDEAHDAMTSLLDDGVARVRAAAERALIRLIQSAS